ncbi:MAG: TrkH family potassium uptake protein [Clostridia bacterium]|nr:TrkH family potassium uptake protein [Clostridia bacterium]
MNYRMILNFIGKIMGVEAVCMMISAFVGFLYGEFSSALWLALGAVVAFAFFVLSVIFKPKDQVFFAKEGLISVALAWVLMSIVGALPFYFSGEIKGFINCVFETVSGLTTTGATILNDVESLSHGMLFWRSFTHWIGGMGVLVLVMAVLPTASGRSMHMLRAEMPGPVIGKLVPKAKTTARLLYIIYIALTILMIILLCFGGMNLFESVIHTFGTAGTGGFGTKADSIASYSPYCQWVITAFMLIFAANFNIYYFVLIKKFSSALKSQELWVYGAIVLSAITLIALNVRGLFATTGETVRHSAFQVASIISTTGYTTLDFNALPTFSKSILLMLMLIGGCAGSTAGGLKVSRLVLLCKMIQNRILRVVHPRNVKAVKFEGKTVDEETLSGVSTYFALYCICQVVVFLLVSLDGFGIEVSISATAATFNNVGPAYGAAYAGYDGFSNLTKVVMSFAMLFGRLEIYPMLILFIPFAWRKK